MSHVYTVTLPDGHTLLHVEAESRTEARRFALQGVQVERLDAGDALHLTRRGIAIVSAKTGVVCNVSHTPEAAG